jgi:Mg-chelatase subunit ChlD
MRSGAATRVRRRPVALGLLLAAAACGSGPAGPGDWETAPADAAALEVGDAAPRPTVDAARSALDASEFGDGGAPAGDGAAASAALAPAAACATQTVRATEAPLDVYFLLDTSASMNDLLAPGVSKWSAVTSALVAFAHDPASAGISVAMQGFPVPRAGVPSSCTSNAACGMAGPCELATCDDGTGVFCASDADCPGSCLAAGACSANPDYVCDLADVGLPCGPDPNGFDLGTCSAIAGAACAGADSCAASDYAAPPLSFEALPGAEPAMVAWLAAQRPAGATPSPAALEGALAAAEARARAYPDHSVVVVLATDGAPDETTDGTPDGCTESDTSTANAREATLAAAALSASPSVRTFAVGVFTPDAPPSAAGSVATLAAAGGTEQAYVVGTNAADGGGSAEAELEAALQAIRGSALPCRYAVPVPEAGAPDPAKLNVAYTPGPPDPTVASTVPRVDSEAACGATDGWYWDVPPDGGQRGAAMIDVCPATCATLRADRGGRVDVVIGCQTLVR